MGEELNIKEILKTYLKYWKWFVLSTIIAVILSFTYLRYTTPQYKAAAKIQISEENGSSSLELFRDLDVFSKRKNNVLDEIEILKSRSNFIEVVKKLNLNTKVEEIGDIKISEVFEKRPININFIAHDSIINKSEYEFYINIDSKEYFSLSEEKGVPGKVYVYGRNFSTPIGDLVLTPNLDIIDSYKDKQLKVTITPVDLVSSYLRDAVLVSSASDESNIVNLSLKNAIPEKAKLILNELIGVYNRNAVNDKKKIANRTSAFIDARIAEISSSLTTVDGDAETLRTSRGISDIAQETNINLQRGAATSQELSSAQNQLQIATSMKKLLDKQDDFQLLPSNIGLSDVTISSTTAKYNQLVQERNRLLKSSNKKNPVIVNLDQELRGLRRTMKSSLNSTVHNLGLTVNTLSGQKSIINSRIYAAPKNERALRDITRKQQTTESLYLYLLQKREEAQITSVSQSPKCKVIDYAHITSRFPVSPKKNRILLASVLLGLIVPFFVIYVYNLLDNKVHNMEGLESLVNNNPILGELPKLSKKDAKSILTDERSILAEALRILRTNLDYLIKTNKKPQGNNNIIYVTSSLPGEGKTFVASNLAMVFASTNKKILLIGADIRNPKIYNFFSDINRSKISIKEKKNKKDENLGLSEYLANDDILCDEIIKPLLVESNEIDTIYSGKIPPNPSELLLGSRMKELLMEVSKKYDYVIVDTAPMMLVTDTLLITPYANHLIYVTRAGITENTAINFPLKLKEEGKIKGLAFLVNGVSSSNLVYGKSYVYGGAPKKWWQFFS